MCFGTFDILHPGHLNYLEQAKKYGDYLIVVVARDYTKRKQRKKLRHNEQQRLEAVQALSLVDEAVLGYPDDHFRIIQEKKPDVLCLGYDQKVDEKVVEKKLAILGLFPGIKRMQAFQPEKYKSSLLKNKSYTGVVTPESFK